MVTGWQAKSQTKRKSEVLSFQWRQSKENAGYLRRKDNLINNLINNLNYDHTSLNICNFKSCDHLKKAEDFRTYSLDMFLYCLVFLFTWKAISTDGSPKAYNSLGYLTQSVIYNCRLAYFLLEHKLNGSIVGPFFLTFWRWEILRMFRQCSRVHFTRVLATARNEMVLY